MSRIAGYMADRMIAMNHLRRAGYSVDEDPLVTSVVCHAVDGLLADLAKGRTMIEFLSRPPKIRADELPVGAVFTHEGLLFELKREPTEGESTLVCYVWNRDDAPRSIDRRQLVSPLGRVVYDDRRKTIKLGLLELAQNLNDRPLPEMGAFEEASAPFLNRLKS